MKLLLMAAALRKDSSNKKLIHYAAELLRQQKVDVDLVEFNEYVFPLYDGDIQEKQGIPDIVQQFATRMLSADGVVLSSPEYNYSTPGTLKNFIDWLSRLNPVPFVHYPIELLSASPSAAGGHRGLLHTRVTLEGCRAFVYPDMFTLANSYEAFDANGGLKDPKSQTLLNKQLEGFVKFCAAVKPLE